MSDYYAQLDDNNVVIAVHITTAEFMAENPERYAGRWVQTYYDRPDKQYAGIGFIYDEQSDDFVFPPSPLTPPPSGV